MLDFTWRIFQETGNIDTYLLIKELEKTHLESSLSDDVDLLEVDFPLS
ncbi:YqzL family protein [Bacillus spongiae]|uniref:YqzL family protein n=1 Tax=Bacillus spongiae TaxID=2683610 RepID=A0ABU8H9F9_9BACI